ncbi:L-lysine 6-transaminase [Bacteroidota bacterium]
MPNNSTTVHDIIGKNMLADGFDLVLDLNKSYRNKMVDENTGETYIDLFTFFASSPLGMNHPILNSGEVREKLGAAAVNKPSNSDIYTREMADFVDTFSRIAKPDYMKHLFFVSGGALAVENGLKVAFDWKVQKNFEKGYNQEKGFKVIHFKEAFHGRSGYTLSLTNTDPAKVKYFPKFEWPRITNPKISFPLEDNLENIIESEKKAITEINNAIKNYPDDVALIIIEPVQGEGGDNFFRKEFFEEIRKIADENDILLMFDEIQTGFGLTGKFWAHEHYVKPDILSFGKKAQVCGIMASERIDEVKNNCFTVSSRINSTWGGNLIDMIRSKYILDIIEEEKLVANANERGKYLFNRLIEIQNQNSQFISNARGLGLMCSFDLPDSKLRDEFRSLCYENKLIILGCGEKSIRFRPPLNITNDELEEGLKVIKKVIYLMTSNNN